MIANDPTYGIPLSDRAAYAQLIGSPSWIIAAATWGVVGVQAALAILLLVGGRTRRWVLALGVPLHLGIAVVLDLPTFGAMMIAVLVISCAAGQARVDPAEEERRLLDD